MAYLKRKRARSVAKGYKRYKQGAQAMVVGNQRRGLPSQELKFIDFELVDLTAGIPQGELISNGTSNNFLLIPEGNGPSARNGRKIVVKQIHARWIVARNNATTPVPADFARLLFVVDTQCNGADPSPQAANTGVLQNMAGDSTDSQAFFNLLNGKRFKILYDKKWRTGHTGAGLAATDTFAGNGFSGKFSHTFKKGLEIEYDNSVTTGATASIRTNNLFAMFFTSTSSLHTLTLVTRVRYLDS